MISGYVLFRLNQQQFALELGEVREIVRLHGIDALPGTRPPMAGVIVLRDQPLPVFDLRAPGPDISRGDVLVTDLCGDAAGVAVDSVVAVLSAEDLPAAEAGPAYALPSYVMGVRSSAAGPVLLVDLTRLLDATAPGWSESLRGPVARSLSSTA